MTQLNIIRRGDGRGLAALADVDADQLARLDPATLAAVTALFREAGALARANRPVVLHPGHAPASRTAPGPDPIDVTIPAPPTSTPQASPHRRRLYTLAELNTKAAAACGAGTVAAMGIDLSARPWPVVALALAWGIVSAAVVVAQDHADGGVVKH